ncbi:MAG: hypothetical protein KIT44_06615 [Opitutaceae bacterium]|nr:hypothetical protein [Opitutaceae bacterium]
MPSAVPSPRRPARRSPRFGAAIAVGLLLGLGLVRLEALTVRQLLDDPTLTPKRFANLFEGFTYQFFNYVQNPDVFLRTKTGDCDDYAILADHVLGHHGYDTRLIHVRMMGRIAHAVCYVTEDKAYLDYNNRRYTFNLERCKPDIRSIATKVARSFEANWTSASEFTYDYATDVKEAKFTVVKTDPPAQDPDRGRY